MAASYSRTTGYKVAARGQRRSSSLRGGLRVASRRLVLGPTTAKYLAVGFVAILALAAVFQKTAVVSTNYKNRELRNQMANVQQDIDALSLDVKRQQSLEVLNASPVRAELVPMEQFVKVGDGVVAGVATSR